MIGKSIRRLSLGKVPFCSAPYPARYFAQPQRYNSQLRLRNLCGVHLLTDDAYFGDPELLYAQIEAALESNATVVQLRLKYVDDREYVPFAERIRDLTNRYGATFIIDDRLDIADAVDADGVHVGEKDVSPEECRLILGPDKIIGVSTYGRGRAASIAMALSDEVRANYIGSNIVFPSITKPGDYTDETGGLDILADTVALADQMTADKIKSLAPTDAYTAYLHEHGLPVIAIGGVTADNAHKCTKRGARGLAVISGLLNVKSPDETGQRTLQMAKLLGNRINL